MDKKFENRILVVEDEAFIAYDIKQTLEPEGYEVIIDCFSMDSAIEMSEAYRPILALVDVNLNSKKSGIDFASYWSRHYNLPFIFITAYSDKETLNSLLHLSPSGFLTKPFNSRDLVSLVYLVLNKTSTLLLEEELKVAPFTLTKVREFIDLNVDKNLNINDLASMTIWGPDRFAKLFKIYFGLSPYNYILKSKIEHSKQLLLSKDEDVDLGYLSHKLGFSNYSSFYKAFKKYANFSPNEFKKLF
jgi:YesN/AraC family two-component response regulator